jgi:HSP20 family protein
MTLMRRAADRRPTAYRDPFRDAMESWFGGYSDPFESWTGTAWPALDVRETDDSYIVEAELPGIRPDDTEILLDGRTLTIHGEFAEEREEPMQGAETGGSMRGQQGRAQGSAASRGGSRNRYLMRERRRGTFVRAITLPSAVDAEQTRSQFENGELVITLPKAQQARARHIEIQGASGNGRQSGMKQVSSQGGQGAASGQSGQGSSQSRQSGGRRKGSDPASTQPNGSEDQPSGS